MTDPKHHSEPAREAVARALHEHFGTSSTTMFTAREAGRQAASVVLALLPASPAPAAGVEAVREAALREAAQIAWQFSSKAVPPDGPRTMARLIATEITKRAALAAPAATTEAVAAKDGGRQLYEEYQARGFVEDGDETAPWDDLQPSIQRAFAELANLRAIVNAAGEARDAAGYLGTAADCIRDLSKDSEALAEIEAMLSDGQGDDDGPQILPDFEAGWSTAAKVEACLHLLEKRRDALVDSPQPHANMTVSALVRARDVMSTVADMVEHQGLTEQAQILRRQADDIRATLSVLIRAEEQA